MPDETAPDQIPPGFKLRHTLRGSYNRLSCIAWSPDGQVLASGDFDGTIQLWDIEKDHQYRVLKRHLKPIYAVDWSSDGHTLASGDKDINVILWTRETGELRHIFKRHSVFARRMVWSPDGRTIATGGSDYKTIHLWDVEKELVRNTVRGELIWIYSLSWSPDSKMIAVGSGNGVVWLWDAEKGLLRHRLKGHSDIVNATVWSPDGQTLASGSNDRSVRLWEAETGEHTITLEGHTAFINSISISVDGFLFASKSVDGVVRVWRRNTWECVAVLAPDWTPIHAYWARNIAFHPTLPLLATIDEHENAVCIWDLDFNVLLGASSIARSVSYTNAKVVLVGESGVGKTGLGVRLAEGVWRPTPGSTHGMNVWPLHSETEREVMLWDFAGQDEYRLVHQLFLNETNVALMLYDPTRSQDTFEGIDYWEKALRNVVQEDVRKILVAARVDVGGVRMTASDIEAYCKAHGYAAHFATSAETNEGCDDLRAAIMAVIPWESLPRTSSPEIFKRIKDYLAAVRQGNRVLVREGDLLAEFSASVGEDAPTETEFRTVIGHVETAGLIKRLSFGDFVLLKPELLNGYASDIVDAARRHPDGLGAVRKADVLDARINLKEEGGLKSSDRIFLLHATVELFLRLGLALEQDGNLVFPSKFNRRMPQLEEDPVVEVEFSFEGPVENLYTTLVVKLYYGGVFKLEKLWKNAAEFLNARGLVCGFQLQHEGEGQGTLKVFYAEGVRDDDKALFLKIVADHFGEKHVEVRRQRIYRCPHCREPVRDRHAVERALERGTREMPCLYCFKPFPLMDALEVLYHDDKKFLSQIAEMESRAEANMERGGELVAASAELRTENFKNWAGGADIATVAIVFTDVLDSTGLNVKFGDEPWRGVREAHFERAKALVERGRGYLIKTIGDSVMAAFYSASDALDFALALQRDTGNESVKIRAGINVGPVEVSSGDAFGQQVSMAARVESKAKDGGIWVSAKVKEDVDTLRSAKHRGLKWTEHPEEELKGFPQKCTLWSVEE